MVNFYLDIPTLDAMLPDHRNHVCLAQSLSPIASSASSCHLVFNKCVQLNHWVDLGHMQRADVWHGGLSGAIYSLSALEAELCLSENLASHTGSVFLTFVLPAFGCDNLPMETENNLSPISACSPSALEGRADPSIPVVLCASYPMCTGILHSL